VTFHLDSSEKFQRRIYYLLLQVKPQKFCALFW